MGAEIESRVPENSGHLKDEQKKRLFRAMGIYS